MRCRTWYVVTLGGALLLGLSAIYIGKIATTYLSWLGVLVMVAWFSARGFQSRRIAPILETWCISPKTPDRGP